VPDTRFVRAHDRELSLWQSAVAAFIRALFGDEATGADVLSHPVMQGTNDHVAAVLAGDGATRPAPNGDQRALAAGFSGIAFEKSMAQLAGDSARVAALDLEFRRYSDIDLGFLSIVYTFIEYFLESDDTLMYHDWQKDGKGDPAYGVIEWKFPEGRPVAVIGDWGTGLPDAEALLEDLMSRFKPAAIVHLGDIYYAGTPEECDTNYTQVFTRVFNKTLGQGQRIPVFSLAGNHDYYAFGYGFYPMLATINKGIEGATQDASFFCLRSSDETLQLLAMDTGYGDANPIDLLAPGEGPKLHASEVEWLKYQIEHFSGTTVLLSHNQLFSAHATVSETQTPYLNPTLLQALAPCFADNVAAWLWGHEHNLALYQNELFGLAKGRLVGCSAYEELTASDPYAVTYDQVPYLDGGQHELEAHGDYYNHGYAIIEPGVPLRAGDPPTISYYQFPSWGATAPASPESKLIYSEPLQ
jgi:hypothetical protein